MRIDDLEYLYPFVLRTGSGMDGVDVVGVWEMTG